MEQKGLQEGSWGDPKFIIAAKNFPQENLSDDKTPMTGIEYSLSQKISLSTKFGNIQESFDYKKKSLEYKAKNSKEALLVNLWKVLILQRKLNEEKIIFQENLSWIEKTLKVSKKLYSTGKISQQAILDIQIRRSQIEISLSNKNYEIKKTHHRLTYLLGDNKLNPSSIPWRVLKEVPYKKSLIDFNDLALKQDIRASELNLSASKKAFIPDLTIGLAYTKRNDIDGNGDFVGASIGFTMPFSSKKYAGHDQAVQENYKAKKGYKTFTLKKNRDLAILGNDLKKIKTELNILQTRTITFAENSRSITSKSYGLGNSTYLELLQSEITLQKLLLEKSLLIARRDIQQITYKFIRGEALNE